MEKPEKSTRIAQQSDTSGSLNGIFRRHAYFAGICLVQAAAAYHGSGGSKLFTLATLAGNLVGGWKGSRLDRAQGISTQANKLQSTAWGGMYGSLGMCLSQVI